MGRVAEWAKQAPGMSLVGVGIGVEEERGVWFIACGSCDEHIHVSAYPVVRCDYGYPAMLL